MLVPLYSISIAQVNGTQNQMRNVKTTKGNQKTTKSELFLRLSLMDSTPFALLAFQYNPTLCPVFCVETGGP